MFNLANCYRQLSFQVFPINLRQLKVTESKGKTINSACENITLTNSPDKMCATFPEGSKREGEGFLGNNLKSTLGTPLICNGELQGFSYFLFLSKHISLGLKSRNPDTTEALFTKVCLFNEWLEQTMANC